MSGFRIVGVACLSALLVVAGCGGSPDSAEGSSPVNAGDSEPVSSEAPVTDLPDTATPVASLGDEAATTTQPAPTASSELADIEGITTITVTTPASGNGEHPLLSWDPVDTAAQYALTLNRSDGQAYWAWIGTEPQIWLGGSLERPPADASGPYLTEPMTLRVVAVDAAGAIFAASQPAEIAP